jgi:hypothetical protein
MFLGWTLGAAAARVVIVTMDRVPPAAGLTRVAVALAPDGRVARALLVTRTGQPMSVHILGDGYLSLNAGAPCLQPAPLAPRLHGTRLDLAPCYDGVVFKRPPTQGILGDTLQHYGYTTGAVGSVNAVALLMDRAGAVDRADPCRLAPTDRDLARAAAMLDAVDVAAVDVSFMAGQDLDATLAWLPRLLAHAPAASILVCAPNPPDQPEVPWPASWVLLRPAPAGVTALASSSTRRVGFVASTDIASTVLGLLGHDLLLGAGRACRPAGRVDVPALLRMADALAMRAVVRAWLFNIYMLALMAAAALMGVAAWQWTGRQARRWRRLASGVAAVIPATWVPLICTGIFPTAGWTLAGEISLGLALVAVIRIVWRRQPIAATWIAAGGLTLLLALLRPDWPVYNLISYTVLKDSRFYGLGNPACGLIVAGLLALVMNTALPADRWRALPPVLCWLAAGWIFWARGAANFGMGIATGVLAVAALLLRIPPGRRLRWALLLGVGCVAVLALMIWIDMASGAQSHIARLVLAVHAGGPGPLLDVILRKGKMAYELLRRSDWSYALLAALAATGGTLWRFRAWWTGRARVGTLLAAGLAAIFATLAINDSGVEPAAIIALAMLTLLYEQGCVDGAIAPASVSDARVDAARTTC